MKKLKRLENLSLENKLMLIVLINIFLVFFIAIGGIRLISHSYNRQLYNAVAGNLSYSAQVISDQMKAMETLSSIIISSNAIQDSLDQINATDDAIVWSNSNRLINQTISNYYQTYQQEGAAGIVLYNPHFVNWTNYVLFNETDPQILKQAVTKAQEAEGAIVWTIDKEHNRAILSRNIRKIEHLSLEPLGDLLIFADLDQMVSRANQAVTMYEDSSYIISQGDDLIYSSPSIDEASALYFQSQAVSPYGIIDYDHHSYFSVSSSIPYYDWTYLNLTPFDPIVRSISFTLQMIALIFLGGFICAIAFSRRITRYMLRDFKLLTRKMEQFSTSELKPPQSEIDYSKRNDEISRLHQQFDAMALRIQNLVQTNYINQILNREAQLKALEAQINPHFLYNTLETINWRAKALKDQQISAMVESLGTLLRATLSNKKSLVPLADEIQMVNCYMTIQKIRFEERLDFQLLFAPELGEAMIPSLTIQPLLENAIRYGMEECTDTCLVQVSIFLREENLIVDVSNEASYFEDNLLEKLENGSKTANGFGIGLVNINQRIQMLFGKQYGLTFRNENNTAIATITIPYQKGETDHAETDHC